MTDVRIARAGSKAFIPRGVNETPVRWVERAALVRAWRIYRSRQDSFDVIISEAVIERLMQFARDAAPNEWIGLLVGQVVRDSKGSYVHILGAVPDTDALASPVSVATTHASEFRTRLSATTLFPDASPIGWTHSHPGYGAYYSQKDKDNQATWSQTYAVGIVVDPTKPGDDGVAVFRGPGSERLYVAAMEPEMARSTPSDMALPASPEQPQHPAIQVLTGGSWMLAAVRKIGRTTSVVVALGLGVYAGYRTVTLERAVQRLSNRYREQQNGTQNHVVPKVPSPSESRICLVPSDDITADSSFASQPQEQPTH